MSTGPLAPDPTPAEDLARRWREERSAAAAAHAAALDRAGRAESVQARRLIADFVAEAHRLGLEPGRLRARAYSGGAHYRTGLRGWYLMRQGTLAVDTAGEYYVLTVPRSWRSWLWGVTLQPSDPPLAVGRGARDGESMALDVLLRLRLAGGNDWS